MCIRSTCFKQATPRPLSHLVNRILLASLSLGVLLAGVGTAHAADFSVLRAGLGAPGVVTQKVLRYPLVRSNLNGATLHGASVTSAALAGGYVAFEPVSAHSFFYVGSLPVMPSELTAVEQALSASNLQMTVATNAAVRASVNVLLVHIEGTATDTDLTTGLTAALAIIGNPQIGVTEVEVPSSALNLPSGMIPLKDAKLIDKGTFSVINNDTVVFSLPRADAAVTHLGSIVASEPLGVGQTIAMAGNGTVALVAELTLRSDEVQGVTAALMAGGFTICTQSDYFVDDSDRYTFIRAQAVSKNPNATKALDKFEVEGQALMNALMLIKKHTN